MLLYIKSLETQPHRLVMELVQVFVLHLVTMVAKMVVRVVKVVVRMDALLVEVDVVKVARGLVIKRVLLIV